MKVSIASTIYIISGLVTLWIVAVPAIIYAIKEQEASSTEEISLLVVTLMLLFVVFVVISISQKNKWLYPTDGFGRMEHGVVDDESKEGHKKEKKVLRLRKIEKE